MLVLKIYNSCFQFHDAKLQQKNNMKQIGNFYISINVIYNRSIRRRRLVRDSERPASRFFKFDAPDSGIDDRRPGIPELPVRILFHQDVQRFRFAVEVFLENHFAPADYRFRAHSVAASHIRMLADKLAFGREYDAYVRIALKYFDMRAFLRRMEKHDTRPVTEIHGQDVGYPVRIRHPDMAYAAPANNGFNLFLFGMYYCFHSFFCQFASVCKNRDKIRFFKTPAMRVILRAAGFCAQG
jgi:hypothetical protein